MRPGELAPRSRRATRSGGRALLVALVPLAVGAPPVHAQIVRGRAIAAADSTPVSGVVVQLARTSNVVVAQTLSEARGGFTLRAPAAGEYRLRALRIGFRPTLGEQFSVADSGIAERSIVLSGAAVTLAGANVTATEQCAAGRDPTSLGFRAWEQARTALAAALVTRQSSTYEMRTVVAELRRAARSDSVLEYTEKEQSTSAMRPFTAMPLARLRDSGYVTRGESGVTYAAPDEEVLLSEEFAVTHCIRARSVSGDELALSFEPTRDRKLSDVSGTLVLSRATGELRGLTYEYVNVPAEERAAHAGGELAFLRFPSGGWMVQRWVVRAPGFELHERRMPVSPYDVATRFERQLVLVAMHETRGEAFRVQQNGALVWAAPMVAIHGTVVDDSTGLPVAGTDVRIAGRQSGAVSDERGRFRLDSARTGDLLLQITAPYAIVLGIPPGTMHLSPGAENVNLQLRVGNPDRAIAEACRAANQSLSDRAPRSIVRGIVRDAHGGRAGVTDVSVTWLHGTPAANEMMERRTRSTPFGDYVVCGVELRKELDVRAFVGGEIVASGKTLIEPGKAWVTLDLTPPVAPSR
ncbi:MAG TPA: carboxypeptidase regulatory-like domain-containing protein [Gemmatimonadaceae bacterium]|nr:carboxypeptidase regulatory-like domain-containing protein [Gemmatimonadaceae bacterium]